MKPQWYKDLPHFWQNVIDQTLHFSMGFLLGYVGPFFSIGLCLAREWWQNAGDDNNDAMDMLTDIAFWTLGAWVMSLVS